MFIDSVKKLIFDMVRSVLRRFKKRIVSMNHPAKDFSYGLQLLRPFINNSFTIIDIGAADGTTPLCENFSPEEFRYLLIEANPIFFSYLDSFQGKYPKTSLEKCFCGESDGVVKFYLNGSGRSSRYIKGRQSETITVPIKKLDTIVSEHTIKGPFLIKIDVEGAEIDVLRGADSVLKNTEVIIVESWVNSKDRDQSSDFAHLIEFMNKKDLLLYDIFGGSTYKNGVLKQFDAVFVKRHSLLRVTF